MRYFVEQLVPSEFLLKQGLYLQTCVHIELLVWRMVQMVDGIDPSSRAEIEKYVRLKLRTRDILGRLRKASMKCYAPLGLRMMLLATRIEVGLLNRNMAAHGAWRLHSSGQLEVEHYFVNKDRELRYVSERISSRGVDAAVEDADHILREALDLYNAFLYRDRKFVSFTAPDELTSDEEPRSPVASTNLRSAGWSASPAKKLRTSTALSDGLAHLTA